MDILKTTLAFVAKLGAEVLFLPYSFFSLAHQGQSWSRGSQIAE